MYKICVYVPTNHLEAVKAALFAAGAGRMGHYEQCCWQVVGSGQFKPLPGAQPHLGEVGQLERVEEYRLEMVCEERLLQAAIRALRQAHPYEEPACDVWRLEEVAR
ncbi:MAG: YqfO family protein [Gammaproteobacteria bacterium]|nr:YqfO family protein [Gammaproteobacteria bacterium]